MTRAGLAPRGFSHRGSVFAHPTPEIKTARRQRAVLMAAPSARLSDGVAVRRGEAVVELAPAHDKFPAEPAPTTTNRHARCPADPSPTPSPARRPTVRSPAPACP